MDDYCYHCGATFPEIDPAVATGVEPVFDGFCSEACRRACESGEKPLCVERGLYAFLNGQLGEAWSKALFKYTDCGAFINIVDYNAIQLGSIIEGSDAETETFTLVWPFTESDFWDTIREIEKQAEELYVLQT